MAFNTKVHVNKKLTIVLYSHQCMIDIQIIKDYSNKLQQLYDGKITEQEWMAYCKEILDAVMEENKDVYVRMKEKD